MTERTIADDLGELFERLGKHVGRMDRHYGAVIGRLGERFSGHWGEDDTIEAEGETERVERELRFGETPELKLSAGMLSVELRPVEAGGTPRLVLEGRGATQAELETGTWGEAVGVEVRPVGRHGFGRGRLTLTLHVPADVRVRGRVDAGAIRAEGLRGAELDLRSNAGKLELRDCEGRLRLRSSAGKLTLENCSGDLEARTDAGKLAIEHFTGVVNLRADAGSIAAEDLRLQPGESEARAGMGSVRMTLARDVPVAIETQASLGSINNEIGQGVSGAPARLRIRTDMGAIRLAYAGPAPSSTLNRVSIADERGEENDTGYRPISLETEAPVPPVPPVPPAPPAPARTHEAETLRILDMVERHEITAAEGAALIAALRQ